MLRAIYLSPLGYIISAAMQAVATFKQPFMVYGYYCRGDRKFRKNTRVSSSASITSAEKFHIGDHAWIGHYVVIDASGGVRIGEGVQISFHSSIVTHGSHVSIRLLGNNYIRIPAKQRPGMVLESVSIGDYSYLGTGATILPGVQIGRGCVIAAGAVVRENVPDFGVAAGVPARIVGDTRDQDAAFVNDISVAGTYFDKERWTVVCAYAAQSKTAENAASDSTSNVEPA